MNLIKGLKKSYTLHNLVVRAIFYVLLSLSSYFILSTTNLTAGISNTIYDHFSTTKFRESPKDIIIIAIDDKSLTELRKWPWPRNYYSSLINYLEAANVKSIALNLIFMEPTKNDKYLAKSILSNINIVLPIQPIASRVNPNRDNYIPDLNIFYNIAQLGHVAVLTDYDGMLRSIPLWSKIHNDIYPNLALKLLQITAPESAAQYLAPKSLTTQLAEFALIQFAGPAGSIRSLSYTDVLANRYPPETFQDKIVFIGSNASGFGDKFTPAIAGYYTQMSGTEIQAQTYDALRFGKINIVLSDKTIHTIAAIFLIITFIIIALIPESTQIWVGLISIFLQLSLSYLLFVDKNIWASPVDSMLVTIILTILLSILFIHLKLRGSNRSLEEHVIKRTEELTVSNTSLAQEISERKLIELILKDNELQLRTILDNLYVGIVMIDQNATILTANKTIQNLFLIDPLLLINQNISQYFFHNMDYENSALRIEEIFNKLDQNIRTNIELYAKRGEKLFPVELNFSRLIQRNQVRYVCLIRDITMQKKSEILTQEFIATVSHELRTPLTSIKGALSLIENLSQGDFTEKTSKLLNIAHRNSDRLALLVNDILDIQKIQLNILSIKMSQINLKEVIEQSVEINESYASQFNTHIIFSPSALKSVLILGDFDRLIQVMSNLLSNAIKFSPENSFVTVSLEQFNNIATVKVTDNGCGIPELFKPMIFQKFAQADPVINRSTGTGLGLSITQALIHRMGGDINFISVEGIGTTFYFTLPIASDNS